MAVTRLGVVGFLLRLLGIDIHVEVDGIRNAHGRFQADLTAAGRARRRRSSAAARASLRWPGSAAASRRRAACANSSSRSRSSSVTSMLLEQLEEFRIRAALDCAGRSRLPSASSFSRTWSILSRTWLASPCVQRLLVLADRGLDSLPGEDDFAWSPSDTGHRRSR